jgi:Uma2 family endonuclease
MLKSLITLDEFLALPEQWPELEYERGAISQKLDPLVWHNVVQAELAMRFDLHGGRHQVMWAFGEVRVTWRSEDVSFVPDVIAYRRERVPRDRDGVLLNHLQVPPDVAVEIHAPGQDLEAQMSRCRWYVEHRVPVALLVHPERRVVWTFRPGSESGPLQGADAIDLGDVIPGLAFTVSDVFSGLRARPN